MERKQHWFYLVLTDELASQCEMLKKAWANATQLLCLFHYLQLAWEANLIKQ